MTLAAQRINERVAALSPAKRELLARRLADQAQAADKPRKALVAYWTGAATEHELRAFLEEQLPDYMQPNVLKPLDELPRTAVGKLDYKALPPPAGIPASTPVDSKGEGSATENRLRNIWLDVLGVSAMQSSDNFFALGGDSILGLQVVSRGRREGLQIAPRDIFAFDTLAELATAIAQRASADAPSEAQADTPPAAESTRQKSAPVTLDEHQSSLQLTPIEHWFFGLDFEARQHWNMPLLLAVRDGVDANLLELAVARVTARHAELSCAFRQEQAGWSRVSHPPGACAFDYLDFRDLSPADATQARTTAVQTLQRSLDLQRGILFRSAYLRCAEQQDALLLLAHHLCVDGVSWRCLLDEIEETYAALSAGKKVRNSSPGASFAQWAQTLARAAQDKVFAGERDYWIIQKPTVPLTLPTDYPAANNLEADAVVLRASLTAAETSALLQRAHVAYKTNVEDLLVAALSRSVLPWANADELSITLERHGRDVAALDCDISATIGWFTVIFPHRITPGGDSLPQLLRTTKENLREVPNGGVGYGVMRYLDPAPATRAGRVEDGPSQLTLNYFGQIDAMATSTLFTGMIDGALSSARSPRAPRAAVFEVQAMVAGGVLHIDWIYSSKLHRDSTAQAVLNSYMLALRELLTHCLEPGSGSYTPSDFPKADLDQDDLDDLLEGLDE